MNILFIVTLIVICNLSRHKIFTFITFLAIFEKYLLLNPDVNPVFGDLCFHR